MNERDDLDKLLSYRWLYMWVRIHQLDGGSMAWDDLARAIAAAVRARRGGMRAMDAATMTAIMYPTPKKRPTKTKSAKCNGKAGQP
jgi:hypothetical protein